MDNQNNNKVCKMKREWKAFLVGTLIGSVFFLFWDFVFNHSTHIYEWKEVSKIEEFKQDSEERLLNYIDGEWVSSIGDVIIKLDFDKSKDFIIIELIKENKLEKHYRINKVNKVNGLFGIVNFDICDVSKACNRENIIPIQFNKVFGMDRTITISYDSRLTYCVNADDMCTRAFKRID